MLHNIFDDSREWRTDKPEGSSAEWYRPIPLLAKLANAEKALADEVAKDSSLSFGERGPLTSAA